MSVFDDFVRLLWRLLRRSHSELNGKDMLMGRSAVKRFFTCIEEGLECMNLCGMESCGFASCGEVYGLKKSLCMCSVCPR